MASVQEIEQAIQQDPTFLKLMKTDQEKAIAFAEEALKMADDHPNNAKAQQPDGPMRTYVRPLLEAGGSIAGGVVGTPLGPAGVLAGGVLGGAGGSAAADVVEQLAGEQQPPKNLAEAGQNTIRNIQTGTIAEAGGQTFNLAMKAGQKLLKPFSHLIDSGKERVMRLAEEMGVNLSPADITGSRPLAMFVEGIGERTPFSAGILERFRLGSLKKLVERRNDLLEKGGTPASIEETGLRIQRRTQELMDELGVTNEQVRQGMIDRTLQKLGSTESYESLGKPAQDSVLDILKQESDRVSNLFNEAFALAPAGERIMPSRMNQAALKAQQELANTNPDLVHPKVLSMIQQFKGSGNRAYDIQQAQLEQAMIGVPDKLRDRAMREYLGDTQLEVPGWDARELNAMRARLNSVIDELDAGLKLTGETGTRGLGKSKDNIDRKILVDLKKALDQDVKAFSDEAGGDFQAALDVARRTAGEVKEFSGSKGVQSFLKAHPQEAARMLAQSKDLQAIRQLKTTMGPAFKNVEDAFSSELLGIGLEGTIGPKFLRAQLNKYPKGVPEAILGEGKVRQITELANQLDTLDASAIQNPIFKTILKSSPERVADLIVKPGNTENIQVVRKMLGPEAVEDLARGVANNILRKPGFDVPNEEFIISPAKLLSGLRRLGDDTLGELFKHDPKFLKEMKELSEVANASQGAAKMAANPSGTGQALVAWSEMALTVYNPYMGVGVAIGVPGTVALYLSPIGRKWLTTGFKTNPNSPEAAKIVGKILGVALADETLLER